MVRIVVQPFAMVNHPDTHLDRADGDDRDGTDLRTPHAERNRVVRPEPAGES